MRLLCWFGLHDWVSLRRLSPNFCEMRCRHCDIRHLVLIDLDDALQEWVSLT
jgi:hypothetical protein